MVGLGDLKKTKKRKPHKVTKQLCFRSEYFANASDGGKKIRKTLSCTVTHLSASAVKNSTLPLPILRLDFV